VALPLIPVPVKILTLTLIGSQFQGRNVSTTILCNISLRDNCFDIPRTDNKGFEAMYWLLSSIQVSLTCASNPNVGRKSLKVVTS